MGLHLNLDGVALCCVLFLRVSGFVQQIVPADLRYVTVFAKGAKIAPQRRPLNFYVSSKSLLYSNSLE